MVLSLILFSRFMTSSHQFMGNIEFLDTPHLAIRLIYTISPIFLRGGLKKWKSLNLWSSS
jgi:hypothetical protein